MADHDESAETHAGATERLTFFSDAVVAIAITLLAIELPIPEGDTNAALLESFGEHYFEYLAFGISFAVIANHWMIHHQVFRHVRRADQPVVSLNFVWLLLVVITPFLTRVITEGELVFVRFALYAVAQALQLSTLAVIVTVVARRGWFSADAPVSLTRWVGWTRPLASGIGFLISLPLFPLIGSWAFVAWAIGPLLAGQILSRIVGPAER